MALRERREDSQEEQAAAATPTHRVCKMPGTYVPQLRQPLGPVVRWALELARQQPGGLDV